MSEDVDRVEPQDSAARPAALMVAIAIAALETLGATAYAISIGIAGAQNLSSVSVPVVELVIYVVFALGIGLCTRALWLKRRGARTPFGVVQLFALVVGYTLMQGDGDLVHRIGWVVLGAGVVGIATVLSPAVGESLTT